MITPDQRLAQDILDALDLRSLPEPAPVINEIGKDERCRLEQQYQMTRALRAWLERWERNPQNEALQVKDDPLWQAVDVLHDHLLSSQSWLERKMEELDEATEQVWQILSE